MIGLDKLAESARYVDALSEEHDIEAWADINKVDVEALAYVASQRALRAAMLMDGQDPTLQSRVVKTTVTLSPEIQALLPALTALSMDGISIGLDAGKRGSRQQ